METINAIYAFRFQLKEVYNTRTERVQDPVFLTIL